MAQKDREHSTFHSIDGFAKRPVAFSTPFSLCKIFNTLAAVSSMPPFVVSITGHRGPFLSRE